MKINSVEKVGNKKFLINNRKLVNFTFYTKAEVKYDLGNKIERLYITFAEHVLHTFTYSQTLKFNELSGEDLNDVLELESGTIESMFLEKEVGE